MSVTFSIQDVPSLILIKADGCDGLYGCVESQWECGCEYVDGPGVNVSQANAHSVLAALGIEGDLWGSMSVDDFLGHVLAAEATYGEDTGFADQVTPSGGVHEPLSLDCNHWVSTLEAPFFRCGHGATMIDCGRPAGYMNQRLSQLRDLCEQARSMGATMIQWG